jgi:sugar phosphate isomerase/epimerase
MSKILITMNSFNAEIHKQYDHLALIDQIALSGADGVEIRKELLPSSVSLSSIKDRIEANKLNSVYSAPVELFKQDHQLNESVLLTVFKEAQEIQASILKISLGHFTNEDSLIQSLGRAINQLALAYPDIQLTIENDQTKHGGTIEPLLQFFNTCQLEQIPIGMTFDIGNWRYVGEDPFQAADQLKSYVQYVHVKQVHEESGSWKTTAPTTSMTSEWQELLSKFTHTQLVAIEFPITEETIKESVQLIRRTKELIK